MLKKKTNKFVYSINLIKRNHFCYLKIVPMKLLSPVRYKLAILFSYTNKTNLGKFFTFKINIPFKHMITQKNPLFSGSTKQQQ